MGPNGARAGATRPSNLREQIHWATPNTLDHLPSRSYEAMKRQATVGGRKNRKRPGNLREQIDPLMCKAYEEARKESNWPTPRAQEPGSTSSNYGSGLKETAEKLWPTVIASEHKYRLQGNSQQSHCLTSTAIKSFRQHQVICKCGKTCKTALNPLFVEWLMGWPIGWTEFEPVEMVSSHWLPLMRGELLQLEQQMLENLKNE